MASLKMLLCKKKDENSGKRYYARGQRYENPDRVKNQSDCWTCYRALEKQIFLISDPNLQKC